MNRLALALAVSLGACSSAPAKPPPNKLAVSPAQKGKRSMKDVEEQSRATLALARAQGATAMGVPLAHSRVIDQRLQLKSSFGQGMAALRQDGAIKAAALVFGDQVAQSAMQGR